MIDALRFYFTIDPLRYLYVVEIFKLFTMIDTVKFFLAINFFLLTSLSVFVHGKSKTLDCLLYYNQSRVIDILHCLQGCFYDHLFDSLHSLCLNPLIIIFRMVASLFVWSYYDNKRTCSDTN